MCGYLCLARIRLRFPSHHLLVNAFFLDCLNVLGNMEMAEGAAREGLLTKEFQSMEVGPTNTRICQPRTYHVSVLLL